MYEVGGGKIYDIQLDWQFKMAKLFWIAKKHLQNYKSLEQ